MGASIRNTLLILLLAIHGSVQRSTPESSTYRAAVAELQFLRYRHNPAEVLDYNSKKIVQYIELAAERGVDIVVFAELALTSIYLAERPDVVARSTVVPDPSQHYRPCNDSSIPVIEALKRVACAAQQNSIYVVVNLLENEICTKEHCPSDGLLLYITSIALDRTGKIVAKSRKTHLIDEYDLLEVIEPPELSTFDTDFGVTFGILICFDIMFENTMLAMTRKLNVTDIAYSSGWFTEMPFFNTVQMEAGWAFAEDVNLLSSGFNEVEFGLSGSGIYAGRQGIIAAVLPLRDHEELLVADVPKKIKNNVDNKSAEDNQKYDLRLANTVPEHHVNTELCQQRYCKPLNLKYDKYDAFQTVLITENGYTVRRLHHLGIDCEFQLNITNLSPSGVTYRLLASDGVRHVGKVQVLGTRVCAIVLCANDTIDSCGHAQNTSATFESANVTVIYVDNMKTVMMPSTIASDMLPFGNWDWEQYSQDGHVRTSISLTTPTDNLITFGLWGRNFEKDVGNSTSRIG